jgi:hypothetical protein
VAADGDAAATVAVRVTDWPYVEGFAEELSVVIVAAEVTDSFRPGALLAEKSPLVSGEYAAVMESSPDPKGALKVACPVALTATGAPTGFPFTLNCTVPVVTRAVDGDTAATVAVRVATWPKADGFAEELRVVAVAAALTMWFNVSALLAAKEDELGAYAAVTASSPGPNVPPKVACPLPLTATGAPTGFPFTLNCTVPVGTVADAGEVATVAVRVKG